MILACFDHIDGPRWACGQRLLPADIALGDLLAMRSDDMAGYLQANSRGEFADLDLLPPIDPAQEVWACGVTYLRSREQREAESIAADVYARVYEAPRPEIFFKAIGWRVVGDGEPIRIRSDSDWNVPEPELTLVVNAHRQIVGYTVGNDVSSRRIEGENPLYLPQAKTYDGSCAIGPVIVLAEPNEMIDLPIELAIARGLEDVFRGETRTSLIKRPLQELVDYATRELEFPEGLFLMTGTGIVPAYPFTLMSGDEVAITVGEITLTNQVE